MLLPFVHVHNWGRVNNPCPHSQNLLNWEVRVIQNGVIRRPTHQFMAKTMELTFKQTGIAKALGNTFGYFVWTVRASSLAGISIYVTFHYVTLHRIIFLEVGV